VIDSQKKVKLAPRLGATMRLHWKRSELVDKKEKKGHNHFTVIIPRYPLEFNTFLSCICHASDIGKPQQGQGRAKERAWKEDHIFGFSEFWGYTGFIVLPTP
jgi:hypothetical protein